MHPPVNTVSQRLARLRRPTAGALSRGRVLTAWALIAITGAVGACSTKRPVLYPDAHLKAVGPARAEKDVEACMRLARDHGVSEGRGERILEDTAAGGAVGGAAGGAAGAVRGEAGRRAATGAAAGAAAGAVRGTIRSRDPKQTYKRFVQKCLRDEGYTVIGWE